MTTLIAHPAALGRAALALTLLASPLVSSVAQANTCSGFDSGPTWTLSGSTLTISGTSQAENYDMDLTSGVYTITRSANGSDSCEQWNASTITSVKVYLYSGNDGWSASDSDLDIPQTIYGGDGGDTIATSGGTDTVYGGKGNDSIYTNGGNDTISGQKGIDTVYAGSGADTIHGGNGADILNGGNGNDIINGNNGADTLNGGNGSDTIVGGGGNDTIKGGNGNDTLEGNDGNDNIHGGAGADQIFGDNGGDLLGGGHGDDVIEGGDGNDYIAGDCELEEPDGHTYYTGFDCGSGSDGDDDLYGDAGDDVICGNGGEDYINGGDGDDYLTGNGNTEDRLYGGNNDDLIVEYGDGDPDKTDWFKAWGQNDDDLLISHRERTYMSGGDDNDAVISTSTFMNAEVYGGNSTDYIWTGDSAPVGSCGSGSDKGMVFLNNCENVTWVDDWQGLLSKLDNRDEYKNPYFLLLDRAVETSNTGFSNGWRSWGENDKPDPLFRFASAGPFKRWLADRTRAPHEFYYWEDTFSSGQINGVTLYVTNGYCATQSTWWRCSSQSAQTEACNYSDGSSGACDDVFDYGDEP